MSQKNRKLVHLCYGIFLSSFIVTSALNLIFACIALYNGGESVFTPDHIASQYSQIAVPIQICVLAIIGGFILDLVLPVDKNNKERIFKNSPKKPAVNNSMVLERLREKVDIKACSEETSKKIKKERVLRAVLISVCAVLCVATAIPAAIYAFNPESYSIVKSEMLAFTVDMSVRVGLWCLVSFIFCLVLSLITNESKKREIAILKDAMKEKVPAPASKYTPESQKKKTIVLNVFRATIVVVALVLVIIGVINGGAEDVLQKAIKLCTECVGLG